MTKEELKPIDVSKYEITETGQVLKMTKQQEFRKQTEEAKLEAFYLMCRKVAELEKENAELKEELTKKADTNHSLVEQMADLENENAENESEARELNIRIDGLIKENAELKKELVEKGQHLDLTEREWAKDMSKMIHFKTQLTKAKEIIKDLLGSENTSCEEEMFFEIRQKAEQFLKEVEK